MGPKKYAARSRFTISELPDPPLLPARVCGSLRARRRSTPARGREMKMGRAALGMVFSLAAIALVAGCGSSTKSGTGGSGAGGSAAGGSGAGGQGTGGKVDGGPDAPKNAPGDTGTDTPAPKPVCGPFADGGMPSDAGVDASANAIFFVTSDT